MIFFILVGAGIFARFLALSGISTWMLGLVIDAGLSNITFVIAMAAVYLIMGCFLDSISMLSITLPVIIPVVGALGIDPIWFAMVTVLAIEVGLITPPVGLNVYATKGVAESDVSLEDVFRGVLPFFLMMLVSLAIIIAFPWLSTILPKLMM
ncbi:C4-dicarboxylate TRAP transporter large permease protein DctM [subsurface metagenome]